MLFVGSAFYEMESFSARLGSLGEAKARQKYLQKAKYKKYQRWKQIKYINY